MKLLRYLWLGLGLMVVEAATYIAVFLVSFLIADVTGLDASIRWLPTHRSSGSASPLEYMLIVALTASAIWYLRAVGVIQKRSILGAFSNMTSGDIRRNRPMWIVLAVAVLAAVALSLWYHLGNL